MTGSRPGPLAGVRVLEFAGLGPAPFCAMLLSDMGAEVLRIDRPGGAPSPHPILERGRRPLVLDLKSAPGAEAALRLASAADVLIEGFRPGVMERLGLGPDAVHGRNRALVYGRMTGWGRSGPYAAMAGHDLNYVALTGALHLIGPRERPVAPLSIVGDHGGGGAFLTIGILAALHHARATGEGQVVDAAILDGVSMLMTQAYGAFARGMPDEREASVMNGAAHFMSIYRCKDERFISFAAFEPQFYKVMLEKLGLASDPFFQAQNEPTRWPEQKARIQAIVATRTQAEWIELLDGTDACFAPVLSLTDAPRHPHNQARGVFVEAHGMTQPAPAPRFGHTPSRIGGPPPRVGDHDAQALLDWGFTESEATALAPSAAV